MAFKSVQQIVIENYGSCNMRCSYCFPEHMWQREGRAQSMPEEMYQGILERTFSKITSSTSTVDIHIAGGEPLLAGQSWLEMAFRVGHEVARKYNKQATFSLQTNATLVTRELAQFLANHKVTVGVSLDGNVEINELTRGNTDRILRGFQLLREATGRSPGVIVTITKCNARRMREVVGYLDDLGVVLFRANQMGASASWNAHTAPDAEDWFIARRDIFMEIAARHGRIMEHNLAQAIPKFVRTILNDVSPFDTGCGCWDMRCPAGEQLMYFDQRGNAYPCPRANVTVEACIGHYASEDFEMLWDEKLQQLDTAMTIAPECKQCPAQFVCDYGCHAFNAAPGHFFEVNCDATKEYFQLITSHIQKAAQIFLFVAWRKRLKELDEYRSLKIGASVPIEDICALEIILLRKLDEKLAHKAIIPQILKQRYHIRD